MQLASRIFSEFKNRYHDSTIVKLVQMATLGGHSPWKGAGRMINQVVWQIVLRDCIIPHRSAWLKTAKERLSDGQANQTNLMQLAKAKDSFFLSVKLLHGGSTASEGMHCAILSVMEADSRSLGERLKFMAFERSRGEILGNDHLDYCNEVTSKTLEKLRWILLNSSQKDVVKAILKEWDAKSLAEPARESDLSFLGTSASSASGKFLPTLSGMSTSCSPALTGKSEGDTQPGSVSATVSAVTSSHGWLSLAGGDPHSRKQFVQSLGALLHSRSRTRDTAKDRLATKVKAERQAIHDSPAHNISTTLSQDPADNESSRSASQSIQGDSPASGVDAKQTDLELRDKINSAVSSHMPPGQSLRSCNFKLVAELLLHHRSGTRQVSGLGPDSVRRAQEQEVEPTRCPDDPHGYEESRF
jgi:hypothetical protein